MDKKIIAVVGGTGSQGGGLAAAIMADKKSGFSVRAITRNATSEKARNLQNIGAEIVEADLDDAKSVEKAFKGAYGAFCVTNFWEHFSVEKEMSQAKNMAEAAKSAGLRHVIWSSLEDVRQWVPLNDDRMPTLNGKYKVPHFDSKGASNQFFEKSGVPATIMLTSFYWENLFGMPLKKGEDGNLVFGLPMGTKKLPGIAVADIGKCAYGVFKRGPELAGKTVGIAGEHPTGQQMADALSKALGKKVNYFAVPFDMFRKFDMPGAEDMANMFQFKHDFENYFCGARNLEFARSLNPDLQTFAEWLSKNKGGIQTE